MEPLSPGSPRQLGSLAILGRLDPAPAGADSAPYTYIGRGDGGDRTYFVTLPAEVLAAEPAYVSRFQAEAVQAQRLKGTSPWLEAVERITDDADPLVWMASPYTPALSLPSAVSAHGGPLPELTARGIAAALAEALVSLHEKGFAHAGISPRAVQLTASGIRLTEFGAVRAAAPDGENRSASPGLVAAATAPEQLAGGRPRPLGDIYAVGRVLAYALTGRVTPDLQELPPDLRDLVAACLARDPAHRPSAATLLETSTSSAGAVAHAPAGELPTAWDHGASRAAGLLVPGWLPRRVSAALAVQAAEVLAGEPECVPASVSSAVHETPASPTGLDGRHQASVRPRSEPGVRGPGLAETEPSASAPAGDRPRRRAVLAHAALGSAGLAVGGAAAWPMTAGEKPPPPTAAQQLVMDRRTPGKRAKGTPPRTRWRYDLRGRASRFAPVIWRDRTVVLVDDKGAFGVELRSGKERWHQPDVRATGPVQILGDDGLVVPGADLTVLDPRDGRIVARPKEYRKGSGAAPARFLATAGGVVWFTVAVGVGKPAESHFIVAFDVAQRRELWRSPVPSELTEGHLLKDVLVVSAPGGQGRKPRAELAAFNRRSGEELWSRAYEDAMSLSVGEISGQQMLIAALGAELRGYDLQSADKAPQWRVKAKGEDAKDERKFGPPVLHKNMAYATDSSDGVYAVEAVSGDVQLSLDPRLESTGMPGGPLPRTIISPDGRLLLSVNHSEVDALDLDSAALRWRFTDVGTEPKRREVRQRLVSLTDTMAVVISGAAVYGLLLE